MVLNSTHCKINCFLKVKVSLSDSLAHALKINNSLPESFDILDFSVVVRCQNKLLDCNVCDCVTVRRGGKAVRITTGHSLLLSFLDSIRQNVNQGDSKFSTGDQCHPCMHILSIFDNAF